jgi:hypothetical protein
MDWEEERELSEPVERVDSMRLPKLEPAVESAPPDCEEQSFPGTWRHRVPQGFLIAQKAHQKNSVMAGYMTGQSVVGTEVDIQDWGDFPSGMVEKAEAAEMMMNGGEIGAGLVV